MSEQQHKAFSGPSQPALRAKIDPFSRVWRKLRRTFTRRPRSIHPFDLEHGTETTAIVGARKLSSGDATIDAANVGYVGSQPSVIRRALDKIEFDKPAIFLDLGSGKGRALIVASEYGFARIIGVEISRDLCEIARRNTSKLKLNKPLKPEIEVRHGSVTDLEFLDKTTYVVYIYNSFGGEIVTSVLRNMERDLRSNQGCKIFVVYYNPVQHEIFDRAPFLARYAADMYPFEEAEKAWSQFGNYQDSVIIYQSVGGTMHPACPGAERRVRITVPNLGADVIMD